MKKLFAIFGLALVASMVLTIWMDYNREWKRYQKEFKGFQLAKAVGEKEVEAVQASPLEVKGYWLQEVDQVDRCITCHQGVDDPRFRDAGQPYRTHPEVAPHSFDRFGCTLCHQGQGRATSKEAAHGQVKHWLEPLLEGSYLQSACGRCHDARTVAGAPVLSRGATLYFQLGCQGCHKIEGRGGDIGPDLTRAGKLSIAYLKESIVDPRANDPTSIMPPLNLPSDQVEALVVYLLSLRGEKPPAHLMPARALSAAPASPSGEQLYGELRCSYCHAIAGKGGSLAPPLDGVGKKRDQDWLLRNLKEPAALRGHAFLKGQPLNEQQASLLAEFLLRLK